MADLPKKQSAKDFIKSQPMEFVFQHVEGECCQYGLSGLYAEAQAELATALAMTCDFNTGWISDRMEPFIYRIERQDGVLTLTASVSMDDPPELTNTLVWELLGKNKLANCGADALSKKYQLTLYKACEVIEYLADGWGGTTTSYHSISFDKGDQTAHHLDAVLNAMDEVEALASSESEKEYNALKAHVIGNLDDAVKMAKKGGLPEAVERKASDLIKSLTPMRGDPGSSVCKRRCPHCGKRYCTLMHRPGDEDKHTCAPCDTLRFGGVLDRL